MRITGLMAMFLVGALPLPVGTPAQAATPGDAERSVTLPPAHAHPAEVAVVAGHVVVIQRGASRIPAPAELRVAVLDRDGQELLGVTPGLDVPDATALSLRAATVGPGGLLVVNVVVRDASGRRGSVILAYDLQRKTLLRTFRTDPVACLELAATTGSIWCLGVDSDKMGPEPRRDFDLVYRYSLTGELQRHFVPRVGFAGEPIAPTGRTEPQLVTDGSEFAAWLPASGALLRWDADGTDVRRLELFARAGDEDPAGDELVMLRGGRIVGLVAASGDGTSTSPAPRRLAELGGDGRFTPIEGVTLDAGPSVSLVGSDDESVVLFDRRSATLTWVPVAARLPHWRSTHGKRGS
jgi:hypothetical protein